MLNNDYGNISGNPACERLKLENNLARINTIKGNVFGIWGLENDWATRVNVTIKQQIVILWQQECSEGHYRCTPRRWTPLLLHPPWLSWWELENEADKCNNSI